MLSTQKPKIGLFAGGIEHYWTRCGMKELPSALKKNALKLMKRLEKNCEVIYPFLVGNEAEARKAGKIFMEDEVDIVLMYHATYVHLFAQHVIKGDTKKGTSNVNANAVLR